jgi:hypothetical protein
MHKLIAFRKAGSSNIRSMQRLLVLYIVGLPHIPFRRYGRSAIYNYRPIGGKSLS